MRIRSRRSIVLLVTTSALAIGWLAWFNFSDESTKRIESDAANSVTGTISASAGLATADSQKPAGSVPTKVAAQRHDALLEGLRVKLTAANVVPHEALLKFRDVAARDRFLQDAAAHGLEILDRIPQLNRARVRYSRLEDLRDAIAASPSDFVNVEGNLWLGIPSASPAPDPNNQGGRVPFGYSTLGAINAGGDRTGWGSNVTVAVLDTGVLTHPTFAEGEVMHLDLVNDGQPFNSHGTSVASMIGGQNPQAPGVAPGVQIMDIRVAGADGYSVSSTLAQGIVAATDRGAQVINISLGGYGDSLILAEAVNYATQHGSVIVAAAGNDAYGQLAIPAAYDNVISVGSVDANNRQAYFSNAGAGLDLAAPGVGVISAWDTDKIAFVSGTSQSAALVSGAAASYLSWGVLPNAVNARLKADARPAFNSSGVATGAGILTIRPPAGR